jgi:hypothetical protein
VKRPSGRFKNIDSGNIRRHQVRRELDARVAATQRCGKTPRQQCLGKSRHAFDQHMPASGDRDEQTLHRGPLTVYHAFNLGLHGAADV